MAWAGKILRQRDDILYLECTFPDGRKAHYVLKADKQRLPELKECIEKRLAFTPADYGTVLSSGWGGLPAESTDNT